MGFNSQQEKFIDEKYFTCLLRQANIDIFKICIERTTVL